MNDIARPQNVMEQVNHQTADPRANASVFLFFSTAHFLKTILASRTNGTFAFARHTSRPFAKPKEPFFANAQQNIKINSKYIMKKINERFKLLLLLSVGILYLNNGVSYAQTTNFYGTNKVQADGHTAALYEVKIDRDRDYTFVKIELIPTRNKIRLKYWTSYNTKIKSGDYEANFLGALSNDGVTYHDIDCDENWGWSNAKSGERYYYTLVFKGAIPPGSTDFSLKDEGSYSGCRGFGFSNYTLNNPDNHPKTYLSETSLKQKVDEQNDGIVGIYEPFDKSGYKLGCIKDGQNYKLVYLSSGSPKSWWKIGDVKAILRPSATNGVFKADWYMGDKTLNSDTYVTFDGTSMKTIVAGSDDSYLKMYPTNSGSNSFASGSQKSSGTGFAISSNGYIVTNYHVIEDAKSIEVKGVNGNFSKKLSAKVVVSDEKNDLAIIKINDPYFTSLGSVPYTFRQGISDVGENIFVLGYPLTSSMGEEIKLTNGIISSKTGYKGDISLYQISAPVQPGNSGGPLFDKNGNLIGIVSAKHTLAENAGYAIKVSYLKNLIELLPQTINQPTLNILNGKGLTEQVKAASNYVYLIVINDK